MKCKYCHRPFEQTRAWQLFCSTEHKDKFHAEERKDVQGLKDRIKMLEKELARLKGE